MVKHFTQRISIPSVTDVGHQARPRWGSRRRAITVLVPLCCAVPLTAQAGWSELGAGQSVPTMYSHSLVYDEARDRVVRYGGYSCSSPNGETWEWDGATWSQVLPIQRPPSRDGSAMVYDPYRRRSVMFGGWRNRNDLWEFDGITWTQRITTVQPPGRNAHMMAYDSKRRCVVMYGGHTSSGQVFNDTWTWDGTKWQEANPATRPPPTIYAGMAYDPVRDRVVMFGGLNHPGFTYSAETWEWDGADWTQRTPPNRPGARSNIALAYDPQRRATILVGGDYGISGEVFDDTWAWDGQDWTQIAAPGAAPGRAAHGMAYDSTRGRIVIHGGGIGFDFTVQCFNDTWTLETPTPGFAGYGTGCPGAAGTPTVSLVSPLPPGTGGTLTVRLSNLATAPAPAAFFVLGLSRQQWGQLSIPWPMQPLGLAACSLWAGPDLVVPAPAAGGSADLTMPNPGSAEFYVQGLVVDTAGVSLSAAARIDTAPRGQ